MPCVQVLLQQNLQAKISWHSTFHFPHKPRNQKPIVYNLEKYKTCSNKNSQKVKSHTQYISSLFSPTSSKIHISHFIQLVYFATKILRFYILVSFQSLSAMYLMNLMWLQMEILASQNQSIVCFTWQSVISSNLINQWIENSTALL